MRAAVCWLALVCLVVLCVLHSSDNSKQLEIGQYHHGTLRRRLGGIPVPVVDIGNDRVLANRTVFGALVLPRGLTASQGNDTLTLLGERVVFRQWLPIDSKPCPHFPSSVSSPVALSSGKNATRMAHAQASHRSERGHGLSHLQTWLDFEFFDRDALEARFRPVPEYVLSTTYSSVSGTFQAFSNGSLHKNGRPYLDEDVLLVAEESLDAFRHVNATRLLERLRDTRSGLAVIASCHRERALCMHAYAITRGAARVVGEKYDVCGAPIEQQIFSLWQRKVVDVHVV